MGKKVNKHVQIGTLQAGDEFWTEDWDCRDEKWGEIVPGHDGVVLGVGERGVKISRTRRKPESKPEVLTVPLSTEVIPK